MRLQLIRRSCKSNLSEIHINSKSVEMGLLKIAKNSSLSNPAPLCKFYYKLDEAWYTYYLQSGKILWDKTPL